MIKVNINESSELSFRLKVEGNATEPKGKLVLKVNPQLELNFVGEVQDSKIVINLPALKEYKEILKTNIIESYLEVVIGDNYFVPWEGKLTLEQPIQVQVEAQDEEEDKLEENKSIKVDVEIEPRKKEEVKKPFKKEELKDNKPKEEKEENKEVIKHKSKSKPKYTMEDVLAERVSIDDYLSQ